jgi:hypothetical protein
MAQSVLHKRSEKGNPSPCGCRVEISIVWSAIAHAKGCYQTEPEAEPKALAAYSSSDPQSPSWPGCW